MNIRVFRIKPLVMILIPQKNKISFKLISLRQIKLIIPTKKGTITNIKTSYKFPAILQINKPIKQYTIPINTLIDTFFRVADLKI